MTAEARPDGNCDIHIPHKEWATRDEHENYLAIERWARQVHDHPYPGTVNPQLLIPHKSWAEPAEAANYLEIERWSRHFQLTCMGEGALVEPGPGDPVSVDAVVNVDHEFTADGLIRFDPDPTLAGGATIAETYDGLPCSFALPAGTYDQFTVSFNFAEPTSDSDSVTREIYFSTRVADAYQPVINEWTWGGTAARNTVISVEADSPHVTGASAIYPDQFVFTPFCLWHSLHDPPGQCAPGPPTAILTIRGHRA